MRKAFTTTVSLAALMAAGSISEPARAGNEPYIGDVQLVAFNFCPRSYASAEGQLLAISQYSALFALIGTQYGGDGRTTFALPDLRGRVPMGQGNGPGLTSRTAGQAFGSEVNGLNVAQMAAHNHAGHINVARVNATTRSPVAATMSRAAVTLYDEAAVPSAAAEMRADTVQLQSTGSAVPFNNMQPSLAMRYCIALQGVFPPRN